MSIKVKLNPILTKSTAGQEVVEVTGRTTGECLENLESLFPSIKSEIRDKQGQLVPFYFLAVNSKLVYSSKELTTAVEDGDDIEIYPLAMGG